VRECLNVGKDKLKGMAMEIEEVDCDLCGSNEARVLPYGGFRVQDSVLNLVICTRCGLKFVNPRPTQSVLQSLYSDEFFTNPSYWSGGLDKGTYFEGIEKREGYYEKVASKFDLMIRIQKSPPGMLLDVGCAGGLLMKEMERHGWQVFGVDVSESATSFAHKRLSLDVANGTLMDAKFADKQFDAIVMKDVLEHVPSPADVLNEARRILADDGALIVHLPTDDSTVYKRMESLRWWILTRAMSKDPYRRNDFNPPHLYQFTNRTLSKYAQRTGFEVREKSPERHEIRKPISSAHGDLTLRDTLRNLLFNWSAGLEDAFHLGLETTFLLRKAR